LNIKKIILSMMLIPAMAILSLSCSPDGKTLLSGDPVSDTTASKPVIGITYSGTFAGQSASGLLNLVVDVTIENEGYESFNTSPELFSVKVDDYSYHSTESDLQTVDLSDGDDISGNITFQVPPVAATTRVGYEMEHSGQTAYNIQWYKEAEFPVSTSVSTPEVLINYSDTYMWVNESNTLYMLVDITIENRGYESFSTSPEYFTLILGNIIGQSDPTPPISFDGELSDEKDSAYSDLRSYDLQNGGKLNGTLAFPVPVEIFKCTERYTLNYSGVRFYNIRWLWKPPLK
jgi:hypothetical protein